MYAVWQDGMSLQNVATNVFYQYIIVRINKLKINPFHSKGREEILHNSFCILFCSWDTFFGFLVLTVWKFEKFQNSILIKLAKYICKRLNEINKIVYLFKYISNILRAWRRSKVPSQQSHSKYIYLNSRWLKGVGRGL